MFLWRWCSPKKRGRGCGGGSGGSSNELLEHIRQLALTSDAHAKQSYQDATECRIRARILVDHADKIGALDELKRARLYDRERTIDLDQKRNFEQLIAQFKRAERNQDAARYMSSTSTALLDLNDGVAEVMEQMRMQQQQQRPVLHDDGIDATDLENDLLSLTLPSPPIRVESRKILVVE